MELQEAFTMRIDYLGQVNPIKVNENGEVCMNDMALYFPNKSLKEWLNNNNTKDFKALNNLMEDIKAAYSIGTDDKAMSKIKTIIDKAIIIISIIFIFLTKL